MSTHDVNGPKTVFQLDDGKTDFYRNRHVIDDLGRKFFIGTGANRGIREAFLKWALEGTPSEAHNVSSMLTLGAIALRSMESKLIKQGVDSRSSPAMDEARALALANIREGVKSFSGDVERALTWLDTPLPPRPAVLLVMLNFGLTKLEEVDTGGVRTFLRDEMSSLVTMRSGAKLAVSKNKLNDKSDSHLKSAFLTSSTGGSPVRTKGMNEAAQVVLEFCFHQLGVAISLLNKAGLSTGKATYSKSSAKDMRNHAILAASMVREFNPAGADVSPLRAADVLLSQIIAKTEQVESLGRQRVTSSAWEYQSYMANSSAGLVSSQARGYYEKAINIVKSTIKAREKEIVKVWSELLKSEEDPLGTNMSYPSYSSSGLIDLEDPSVGMAGTGEKAADDAKFAFVVNNPSLFSDLRPSSSYDDLINLLKNNHHERWSRMYKVPKTMLDSAPLGYFINRRSRLPGKSFPFLGELKGRSTMLRSSELNPTRAAYAASWLLQLNIAPYAMAMKAVRMVIPGLIYDESTEAALLRTSRSAWTTESDISRYDLNFALNVRDDITGVINDTLGSHMTNLVKDCVKNVTKIPMVGALPISLSERSSADRGNYEAMKSGESAKKSMGFVTGGDTVWTSGTKLTPEHATIANLVATIASELQAGIRTEDEWLQYLAKDRHDSSFSLWHVFQGDDKLSFYGAMSMSMQSALEQASKEAYDVLGVDTKQVPGDKFLMRHRAWGLNLPVVTRILQNTVGSESTVPDDKIAFTKSAIGLIARCDGILYSLGVAGEVARPGSIPLWERSEGAAELKKLVSISVRTDLTMVLNLISSYLSPKASPFLTSAMDSILKSSPTGSNDQLQAVWKALMDTLVKEIEKVAMSLGDDKPLSMSEFIKIRSGLEWLLDEYSAVGKGVRQADNSQLTLALAKIDAKMKVFMMFARQRLDISHSKLVTGI